MIFCDNYDLNIEYETVGKYSYKEKKTTYYIDLPCSFDIETSSTMYDDQKFAFMYEWTFGIGDNGAGGICYGRTWDQFINVLDRVSEYFKLSSERILICYVHNLSYEFQFMRKYFNWVNVFAVDDRKPIKALTDIGIEFRDSYILSGYSLAKLAENLVSHNIEKLVGDLDYSLCRTSETPLTDLELSYCNNDVEIVLDYIAEQISQYGNITRVPLTNTGRVRKFVSNRCFYTANNHKKSSWNKRKRYQDLMQELVLTSDQYAMLKRCFMGGFTHASMQYVGKHLHNVYSIDFTSSYPAVMLSEKFPMSRPIAIDIHKQNFWQLVESDDYGLMFDCKFTGLRSVNTYESYLSESKCYAVKGGIINNGRIFQADELTTTITDIDLKIIQTCYTYDSIQVANVYKFYLEYLPLSIITAILELYGNKTSLKGVEGKEIEYLVSKGMLNSVYGMCVTDIVRPTISYGDEWNIESITSEMIEDQIVKYNESGKRFLYYPWGVWVTAYARRNLFTGITAIGNDYVYSDTDSIKFLNYKNHLDYIAEYNKTVESKLRAMCNFRHIDFELCRPLTKKNVQKLIGVWDLEGNSEHFKTLGAKRYIYFKGNELHITIAGLSKQDGADYISCLGNETLLKQYKKENKHPSNDCPSNKNEVIDFFNDDLYIPPNATGKNTHTYIDFEIEGDITDYLGHTMHVISRSGIHLSECDYTLSIAKKYAEFLDRLLKGELYAGEKAI